MDIKYSKAAAKAVKSLDSITKKRIKNGIEKLPDGDVKKLKGYINTYRLRIGDYRILFEMKEGKFWIDDILPRGDAYK